LGYTFIFKTSYSIQIPKRPFLSPLSTERGILVTTFPILALISEAMIGVDAELSFAISGAVGGCQVSDVLGGAVRAQAILMWKEDDLSSVLEGEFESDCVGSLLCAGVSGSGAAAEA
jgi:hypothetical protein